MKKIYIGNLPYSVTEDQLRDMFGAHGEVASATVVKERDTGRSKGFGFVEMDDDGAATTAIDALNGTEVDGRTVTVNEARPSTGGSGGGSRSGGGGGRGGFGGGGGGGRGGFGGGGGGGGRGGFGGGGGGRGNRDRDSWGGR